MPLSMIAAACSSLTAFGTGTSCAVPITRSWQ
jgi:hypothetical protein